MKDENIVSVEQLQNRFLELLKKNQQSLLDTGKALVALLDADDSARERLIKTFGVQASTLTVLERVGRGHILPEFAHDPILRSMTMAEQKKIEKNPMVEMLILKEDGKVDQKLVDITTAPAIIRKQIVYNGRVRSIGEQRSYLAAKSNESIGEADESPWRREGKFIYVKRGVRLSAADLRTMLRVLQK